jgi:hypothetical protein
MSDQKKKIENREGGYTVLPLSVCLSVLPSKIFFVAFFSATIDSLGMPYRGKRFWNHQIPTSCLPTLLIFIHIELYAHFSQQLLMAEI